jgi:hypothetical protein
MTSVSKWIVELKGHHFDLEDLPDFLHGTGLSVEEQGNGWILAPSLFTQWTDTSDSHHVEIEAHRLVELINGLARCLIHESGAVEIKQVCAIDTNGVRNHFVSITEVFSARAKVSDTITSSSGRVVGSPRGAWRHHARAAIDNENIAKALQWVSRRPTTWGNLYKAFELVRAYGRNEREMIAGGWTTKADISLLRRTANSVGAIGDDARHGVDQEGPPKQPMDISTAAALVRRLVKTWIEETAALSKGPDELTDLA